MFLSVDTGTPNPVLGGLIIYERKTRARVAGVG